MQILLIMLIVVLLAFSVLLLALAKQSPREKQTEDKEQEEYIRDYAETVRQTGGSMKKLEHWKVIAIYLIIYDMIAVNFSYFMALLVRFDFRYSSIPTDYFDAWRSFAPIYTIIILAVFGCLHLYNSVWRFASFHELIKITVATVITGVLHIVGITIFWGRMPASYYLIGIMLQFFLTVGVRFSYRFVLLERNRREKSEREERSKNVMIIGAGEAGRTIVRELQNAKETNSRVRCLIDDNPNKWGRYMEGVPVVGGRDDIFLNVDKYHINQILLAIPTATPHQKRDILNICKETGCELKQLPGVYQLVNGEVSLSKMKKVAVEDLLGRDTIKVNMSEIFQYLKGKRILVTGGGGSIGSELCRQIAGHEPELLVIFDIYENNAYDIEQELKASYPNLNLKVLIGSVRDSKRINWVFETYKPEIVYHAAAHKHVPLMENSPCEAIKNNVVGTYKTAYAAMMNGCQRFVLISTDKAVNPTNIMGASKRLCEMVVQSMNMVSHNGHTDWLPRLGGHRKDTLDALHDNEGQAYVSENHTSKTGTGTEFVAVRFGNVLGSNGSCDPAVQAPDRKRRPCHRHTSGHHPLLYDYPGGRKPCPPGRNLRQRRRDLRPGHGSPGKDRHPCPKPDQAFRLHPGCRHQSHLHWSPPRRKALRRKADGRRRHGENSKRPHPHRQTHRNGRTGILQTAGSPGSIRLRQQRKDPRHRSRDRTDLSLCGFRPEAA